ncbi:MAG: glycosyltransferase family 4 protein [Chloroflexi bacterium]|nr:glycosyltransferase family 4 protein [Chloroflexota bacterium]
MRVAFVMEQHIGHRTFYQNLRHYVSIDRRIDPRWIEVSYFLEGGRFERSKWIPASLKGPLRGFQQSRSGLRSYPYDAAFFNTQVPAVFAMDMTSKIPCIISTDITPIQYDLISELYGQKAVHQGIIQKLKYQVNRKVFHRAAHMVAWSSWVRDSLLTDYGLSEDKVSVIPPGIDLEAWRPGERFLQPPTGPIKILFVGGDFKRKGGNILLEAYRMLDPSKVELHLVTQEPVPHVPGIHIYHGLKPNSSELIRLYRECHLFVLPTLAEAFGIAAIEALSSGLPVIASRVGGLVDIIDEGKNGFLVPAGDAGVLAETIRKVISRTKDWPDLCKNARKSAEERFDARKNADRCISLILEFAGRGHA